MDKRTFDFSTVRSIAVSLKLNLEIKTHSSQNFRIVVEGEPADVSCVDVQLIDHGKLRIIHFRKQRSGKPAKRRFLCGDLFSACSHSLNGLLIKCRDLSLIPLRVTIFVPLNETLNISINSEIDSPPDNQPHSEAKA